MHKLRNYFYKKEEVSVTQGNNFYKFQLYTTKFKKQKALTNVPRSENSRKY